MNLGIWEVVAIAIVALVFFGPSRLPQMGKSIGEAIRGFKKGLNDDTPEPRAQTPKSHEQVAAADDSNDPTRATEKTREKTREPSDS